MLTGLGGGGCLPLPARGSPPGPQQGPRGWNQKLPAFLTSHGLFRRILQLRVSHTAAGHRADCPYGLQADFPVWLVGGPASPGAPASCHAHGMPGFPAASLQDSASVARPFQLIGEVSERWPWHRFLLSRGCRPDGLVLSCLLSRGASSLLGTRRALLGAQPLQ